MVVVAPLGLYIPSNITAKVDGDYSIPLVLQTCTQQGCIAIAKADRKVVKALKAGNKLVVSFAANANDPAINIDVSLEGVSAGLMPLM